MRVLYGWVLMTVAAVLALTSLSGCVEDPVALPVEATPLTIQSILAPSPLLGGSPIEVAVLGVKGTGGAMRLQGFHGDGTPLFVLEAVGGSETDLTFSMSPLGIDVMGPGVHDIRIAISEGAETSELVTWQVEVAKSLDIALGEVAGGERFRNDLLVLNGSGFLAEGEGVVLGVINGTFTASDGQQTQVSTEVPVALGLGLKREQGLLRLTTALGGVGPGEFLGGLRLRSTLVGGEQSLSTERTLQLTFKLPEVSGLDPIAVSLGQLLSVLGGGFLGAPGDADEVTLLRFEGTVDSAEGTSAPFGPQEIVAQYVLGTEVTVGLATEVSQGKLISSLLGIQRGAFYGSVTPIVIMGAEEVSGVASAVSIDLRGPKQMVEVRLLPGYFESLTRFGLGAAGASVAAAILQRLEGIYAEYAVEFALVPPPDFLSNSYATLEIGGPDPNGYGLFGYDNTPGKDVGNLRLYDSIGGENADTQADGYPGYGGVFIESYLWWSSHPGLVGARPNGAPPPDPLFDEIFDAVRSHPATVAETTGLGDAQRVYLVQRAIYALGAVVGETAAHELGHSLGLAQPEGPGTAYHSLVPGDGCLMDGGADRPLGERAAQPGYSQTRFCASEPAYLQTILAP